MINWSRVVVLHTSILRGVLAVGRFLSFWLLLLFLLCLRLRFDRFFSSLVSYRLFLTFMENQSIVRGAFLNFFFCRFFFLCAIHLTPRFILTRFKIKSVQFEFFLFVSVFERNVGDYAMHPEIKLLTWVYSQRNCGNKTNEFIYFSQKLALEYD